MGTGGERVRFLEEGWGDRALLHFHCSRVTPAAGAGV